MVNPQQYLKLKKKDTFYALKIFDNDLVERFGYTKFKPKELKQEIALKNHSIPNLVKIFEGGNTDLNSQKYYFLCNGTYKRVEILKITLYVMNTGKISQSKF